MQALDPSSANWNYLDHLPIGCCITTNTFQILEWNRLIEHWTGKSAEVAIGRSLFELVPQFLAPNLRARLELVVGEQAPAVFSSQLHDPIFPCSINGAPLLHEVTVGVHRDPEDKVYLVFSIVDVSDLTNRLDLAKEARRNIEKQAKALEYSNRELTSFANIVSHDLKSPLRGIQNLASWLEEDAGDYLPKKSSEHLKRIQSLTSRMGQLLDDLLVYSTVGSSEPPMVQFNLHEALLNILQLLVPQARISVEISGDFPEIISPRPPLETVLRNLLSNAVKHNDKESGVIKINGSIRKEGLLISVSDNGPGIAKDYHSKIFDIFETLRPRDVCEGSGMGLAIVRKTLENAGGKISIKSADGSGAIFEFFWPCSVVAAARNNNCQTDLRP